MKNTKLTIIAGPCSVDENNIREIEEISKFEVKNRSGKNQKAIAGTRIVGLKSRTEPEKNGAGMGMDFEIYQNNIDILMNGGGLKDFEVLPSAFIAQEISDRTGMIIATEIMNPIIQLPSFENRLGSGKLLPWNPAVNQLGWHIEQTAYFVKRNNWHLGIKNGKWIGDHLDSANAENYQGKTTMEKTWAGLAKYASSLTDEVILIHRGVDVPGKGNFRNALVHNLSARVKKTTNTKLYFDPSHSFGPKLRSQIVSGVVEAMKMKISGDEYLYDGVLIETGTSKTDTNQHITVAELYELVKKLIKFRDLVVPNKNK